MTTFIPDIDQVTFASAVIATDKKQKLNLYDSARVVWIFETIFKPTHHLPKRSSNSHMRRR